jgi:hypothetical protein
MVKKKSGETRIFFCINQSEKKYQYSRCKPTTLPWILTWEAG